jgi:quinol-cytochrome oxidoreductase complex cytochrome b subunit
LLVITMHLMLSRLYKCHVATLRLLPLLPQKLHLLMLKLQKQSQPQKNNRRLGVVNLESSSCKLKSMASFFHHE